jgi:hypothetical protein
MGAPPACHRLSLDGAAGPRRAHRRRLSEPQPPAPPPPAAPAEFLDALPDSLVQLHLLPALDVADKRALRWAGGGVGWGSGSVDGGAQSSGRPHAAAAGATPCARAHAASTGRPSPPRSGTCSHARALVNTVVRRARVAAGDLLPPDAPGAAAPRLGRRFPGLTAVEAYDCADAPVTDDALAAFLDSCGPEVGGCVGGWVGGCVGAGHARQARGPSHSATLGSSRAPRAARPLPAPSHPVPIQPPPPPQILSQITEVNIKRCHYVGRGLLQWLRARCPRLKSLAASRCAGAACLATPRAH